MRSVFADIPFFAPSISQPVTFRVIFAVSFSNFASVRGLIDDVNVMFLHNRQSTTNEKDAAVPNNFEGYTMQLGYKYKNKYLVDLNMAYNGTDRFGKDNN